MKQIISIITVSVFFVATALASCTPPPGPGTGFCNHGVCVDLSLVEPIQFNQPVTVNISVQTDQAQSQMPIELDSQVDSDEFGQTSWLIDTQANVPVLLSTTVTLQEEGGHFLFVNVLPNNVGEPIGDHIIVHLTAQGGTIIPPGGTPTATIEDTYPLPPTILKTETPTPYASAKTASNW